MGKLRQWLKTMIDTIVVWLRKLGHIISKLWDKRHILGREFKHKQRFVVMDTETYREKWSFQLSGINLFVALGISMIVLVALTIVLIAFTPLRELIPGYTNSEMVELTYQNSITADSIAHQLALQEQMMADMKDLLMGNDPEARRKAMDSVSRSENKSGKKTDPNQAYKRSDADSTLRKEVEKEDRYVVRKGKGTTTTGAGGTAIADDNTPSILLFTPMKGKIVSSYDAKIKHYGVDIAGVANETIKSVASGTVVFANFTTETGYVIAIQHQGGMISLYKHNSALLKRAGDVVRAGEPIAYLGNSGDLTTGPHLHFELWVAGKPVNPLVYISF